MCGHPSRRCVQEITSDKVRKHGCKLGHQPASSCMYRFFQLLRPMNDENRLETHPSRHFVSALYASDCMLGQAGDSTRELGSRRVSRVKGPQRHSKSETTSRKFSLWKHGSLHLISRKRCKRTVGVEYSQRIHTDRHTRRELVHQRRRFGGCFAIRTGEAPGSS